MGNLTWLFILLFWRLLHIVCFPPEYIEDERRKRIAKITRLFQLTLRLFNYGGNQMGIYISVISIHGGIHRGGYCSIFMS